MLPTGGKKYSYFLIKSVVYCYPSRDNLQWFPGFAEAEESVFHDSSLRQLTAEINQILTSVDKGNKDPSRKLSILIVGDRLFLVWAKYGAVTPESSDEEVVEALGLK